MPEDKTESKAEEKTFLEKTQPRHILEIMSKDLLKMLLDSYRFPLETALTVYYSKSIPASVKTIDWLEMTNQTEEMHFNSPFCFEYRRTPPECEKCCKLCDTQITLKYYNSEWRGAKLFHCHLHLWEMTYPLFVWGRLVAVLYGGQVIVTEPVEDWRDALKEVELEIAWKPFEDMDGDNKVEQNSKTEKMDQIERVCEAIDSNKSIQIDKEGLKKMLREVMEVDEEGLKELVRRAMRTDEEYLKKTLKETVKLDEDKLKELLREAVEGETPKKEMSKKRDQIENICTCMVLINNGKLRSEDMDILKELLRKSVENEIPLKSNQIDEVLLAIEKSEELKNIDDKKKKLIDILNNKQKKVNASQLLERYDKFKKFGKTLEKVIGDLFAAKAEAARHEHKHSSARKLAKAGDILTEKAGDLLAEEEEKFWENLDELVKETLPDVKGYVLCKSEEYKKGFKLGRTCIYDKQRIAENNKSKLSDLCKQVFEDLWERARDREFILYDLTNEAAPVKYHDLLRQAVTGWEQILGWVNIVVVPFMEGSKRIAGGLVCICISEDEARYGENNVAENMLEFYVKAFKDIADTLVIVMARQAAVERQTKLLDAQRKAILCMMHTIQKPLVDIKSGLTYVLGRKKDMSPLIAKWITHVKQSTEDAQVIAGGTARVFRALVRGDVVTKGKIKLIDPVEETKRLAKRMSLLEKGHPTDWFYHNPKRIYIDYSNLAGKSGILTDNETFLFTIYNLLDNAIKYSYRGRHIGEERYVYVIYEREGNDLCIKIKSYGPVIPIKKGEEDKPFELFWRGEDQPDYAEWDAIYRPGLGVGLWVSRELVNAAGGKIWLVPRTWDNPHFTIFAVKFPIAGESKT